MRNTFLISWIVLVTPTLSFAQSPQADAQRILSRLRQLGVNSIGDLYIDRLSEQIDRLKWDFTEQIGQPEAYHPVPHFQFDPESGKLTPTSGRDTEDDFERRSGHYDLRQRKIDLSDKLSKTNPNLPYFEIHEAFGALGYNDKNYALTVAIMTLVHTSDDSARKALIEAFGQTLFKNQNLVAGAGSVGGGGDINALEMKEAVLRQIIGSGIRMTPERMIDFDQISFEPFYKPDEQFLAVKYQIRFLKGTIDMGAIPGVLQNGPEELLTVHCPAKLWQESQKSRAEIVKEISKLILSLVPTKASEKGNVVIPEGCPASRGLSFVENKVHGMLALQIMKVMYIGRCGDPYDLADEVSTTYPSRSW